MKNTICDILGIEKPIVQGPMAWLTNASFVASISQAGALGVLSVTPSDYEPTSSIAERIENLRTEIGKIKKLTQKPFGLNLIFSNDFENDHMTNQMINLMVEENVTIAVVYAYNYIEKWFHKLKENHIKIIFRPATPYKEIILAAVDNGADIIVATGFDEGGTIPSAAVGTFSAIPFVADVVEGKVPVLGAGGIVDQRTTNAALALGADGVFVGTAFLASEESPMHNTMKKKMIELTGYDEIMFKAIPAFYRSIPGKFPNHLKELEEKGMSNEDIWKVATSAGGLRTGMLLGDLDNGFASFGLGVSFIKKIEPVKMIVDRLY